MEIQKLLIRDFLSMPHRGYASTISDPIQLETIHCHDYYELSTVYSGSATHCINGEKIPLQCGCVCFIRPPDVHGYTDLTPDFQLINIIIAPETIDTLFAYLGESFEPERLLSAQLCPLAQLSPAEQTSLLEELQQLVVYKEILKGRSDALFKVTLMNIITRYFPVPIIQPRSDIPEWLRLLCLEMFKKDNFKEGLPALLRLSQKSQEHLSRSFRKHLGKSPTQFINETRVRHAARLMLLTDEPIINICYDVGFNNLSNFYHLFKKSFHTSPKQLRKDPGHLGILDLALNDDIFDATISSGVSPFL